MGDGEGHMRQRHVGEEAVRMLAHAGMWEENGQYKQVEDVGEQGREGMNWPVLYIR